MTTLILTTNYTQMKAFKNRYTCSYMYTVKCRNIIQSKRMTQTNKYYKGFTIVTREIFSLEKGCRIKFFKDSKYSITKTTHS